MFETFKEKLWVVIGPVASIIQARATALLGLVTAGVGFMDWSPLLSLFGTSTDFNPKQVASLGIVIFIKGLFEEFTRRINDPFLKVSAAIEAAPAVAKAKKAVKKIVDKTPEVK